MDISDLSKNHPCYIVERRRFQDYFLMRQKGPAATMHSAHGPPSAPDIYYIFISYAYNPLLLLSFKRISENLESMCIDITDHVIKAERLHLRCYGFAITIKVNIWVYQMSLEYNNLNNIETIGGQLSPLAPSPVYANDRNPRPLLISKSSKYINNIALEISSLNVNKNKNSQLRVTKGLRVRPSQKLKSTGTILMLINNQSNNHRYQTIIIAQQLREFMVYSKDFRNSQTTCTPLCHCMHDVDDDDVLRSSQLDQLTQL
ncbi:hypothetical protein AGLY_007982 [Aphis glycines]|uniref:Uncharacterized protein n=1 Tax=Aphis glycines TaxID=307491 RepID=A0A6G0TMF3_APHGL|nr:hypothetical protein AGLY_007982 [Aphis glycines]